MTTDRDVNQAVYVISVAAELAGVHPQTLPHLRAQGPARPVAHERRAAAASAERRPRPGCAASRS